MRSPRLGTLFAFSFSPFLLVVFNLNKKGIEKAIFSPLCGLAAGSGTRIATGTSARSLVVRHREERPLHALEDICEGY